MRVRDTPHYPVFYAYRGGSSGLSGAEVDAYRTESLRAGLLRRISEYLSLPSDLEVQKAGFGDHGSKLCFQQSAGYSAGP